MRAVVAALVLGSGLGIAAMAVGEAPPAPAPAGATPAASEAAAADVPYEPAGRRDPFRPPQARAIAAADVGSPLQRYELGQLKLVAVIYDTASPRAVVEDDAGLGYIVRPGTEIGMNGGVVRAIDRGRILVEEQSVDFFGETRSAEVILEMASGERGSR